jgi:hypothetical protein
MNRMLWEARGFRYQLYKSTIRPNRGGERYCASVIAQGTPIQYIINVKISTILKTTIGYLNGRLPYFADRRKLIQPVAWQRRRLFTETHLAAIANGTRQGE